MWARKASVGSGLALAGRRVNAADGMSELWSWL